MQKISAILLSLLLPLAIAAQLPTGSWKVYPAFGDADKIIETPHFVYVATAGSLHSYDKDNDESRYYEPRTDLSGNSVRNIYYNYDKRYLLVAYTDGNIDILPDDAERINLPDIRDAGVTGAKEINDVKFDDGKIYIATSFGIVIYSDSTFEVIESGIFNVSVIGIATTPDHLLVITNPDEYVYRLLSSPKTERHNRLDKFSRLLQLPSRPYDIVPLGSASSSTDFAVRTSNKRLYHLSVSPGGYSASFDASDLTGATALFGTPEGEAFAVVSDNLYHITSPWSYTRVATVPEPLRGNFVATLSGAASVWAADRKGLGNYNITDGGMTVLRDKFRPSDATTFSDISNIFPISDGSGFLVGNLGLSLHFAIGDVDDQECIFSGNVVTDGHVSDIEVNSPVTIKTSGASYAQQAKGNHIFSPTFVLQDPDDPSIHYVGTGLEGIYVIKNGEEIGKFDENSKIYKVANWAWRVCSADFDDDGNMLVTVSTERSDEPVLIVLPADKRRKDPRTITADDWVALDMGGVMVRRDMVFAACRKSPVIIMQDGRDNAGFCALYHRGTITDPSDDVTKVVATMTDQDGKTFSPQHTLCFTEDKRGRVWAGSTQGIYEISNPLGIFNSDFHINRLKVPRNDGTNLADYLLETEKIYAIAVDNSNRKWIGTADSGLYLVSENGDEVLANFNTSNSPLATNCITDVHVDPNSNSVFVSTLNGLYEYSSTSSPGRPDYSDVYAYPNPVTPDFTGLITIKGLMDSSLVKIMDSGMHLVYQTTSEGGMALWDGRTLSGARAKTGIYYVLASRTGENDSQGDVVAKILVVD